MKRTQQDVGTIIRKKRTRGPDVWVWRFYETDEMGITRKRSVMLAGDVEGWPTEAHAWLGSKEFRQQRLEKSCGQSFGALVRRYTHEALPERYSTKKSYLSILNRHILPKWGDAPLAEVKKPFKVEEWLKELKHSPKTKSNIKGLLHRIFEYAMKWEVLETQRNPMELVEIKGVTKRVRKKIVLTVEQYHALLAALPYQVQVMVMVAMCLGLRMSEIRALQWHDFDLKRRILTLSRSIVGRYVWNGGKQELQKMKWLSIPNWCPYSRTGGSIAWKHRRVGCSLTWTPDGPSTVIPFKRTICDRREKKSGGWEWVGTLSGTRTEPSLMTSARLSGYSNAS